MDRKYLFTSERLGFRNWQETDIIPMTEINADPAVMEFFPGTKTPGQTREFVTKMQLQMTDIGFCYFAVDVLANGQFIGFIGLSWQTFEAPFTPCVDVGWRLSKAAWNNGYATEGAKRCLEYGLHELYIPKIYAMAPKINIRSEQVMKKAGMVKVTEFIHPLLLDDERLRACVLYEITKTTGHEKNRPPLS